MPEQTAHDRAVAAIEKMWGGGEEEPQQPAQEQQDTGSDEEPVAEEAEAQSAEEPEANAEANSDEESQGEPEVEMVETEIDGELYAIPKKISDRFLQHADYTRKTQDIAEVRRALVAEREAQALSRAFEDAVKPEREQLQVIDYNLAQFKQIDWSQIDDPQRFFQLRQQMDSLKDSREELVKAIDAKRGEFNEKIKVATAEATKASQKYLDEKLKGFGREKKDALFSYGLSEGYTRDELDRIADPRIVVTMWKASQWDALQASKPNLANKTRKAAPVVKPGATQQRPTQIQQLNQRFAKAKSPQAKKQAAEDYFAARFGGG